MSESSAHLTPSPDTSALAHSSPPSKSSISLLDFPPDATLQIWRKHEDMIDPQDGGSVHVSELIPDNGDHLLICFDSMTTSDWKAINCELSIGDQLGLKPLLVAGGEKTQIGCGLYGANSLAGVHGLTNTPNHPMVFSPSQTLLRLLGIGRYRTHNALILIRDGHIVAKWVSGGDGDQTHDWERILAMVG